MANASDFFDRTARALPRAAYADILLRLPLAGILLQYGLDKFPLSPDMAAGFGVPFALWALAGIGEVGAGLLLLLGGVLRGSLGDLITRIAGAGAAIIVAGVIYVAYWAPPLDLLLFNQMHLMMLAIGLFFALNGRVEGRRAQG
jgi:putative oxidoreductase